LLGRVSPGGVEQPLHLVDREGLRQPSRLLRRLQLARDVAVNDALVVEKPMKPAYRRRDARGR
jgi:hypothetical protein